MWEWGAIPLLGDAFDFIWRSNRRNLELIEKHRGGEGELSFGDYAIVAFGLSLALIAILLPFAWAYLVFGIWLA